SPPRIPSLPAPSPHARTHSSHAQAHTAPTRAAMALTGGATTAACILVLLALADAAGAATRAPAPAPAPDCMEALISLADCLDYVTPSTKSARPSKACCTEVKTAVGTPATVKCLCAAMDAKTTPIPINMTRVLALPTACGQSASVLNKCHG
uniref:Bifunctional inhibitor/plant lipid transfer protein/seed storage helical domain-containing protein n=2 Tax=Triticinae TaxID=1648030 RepID=A0A453PMM5_AEGTS